MHLPTRPARRVMATTIAIASLLLLWPTARAVSAQEQAYLSPEGTTTIVPVSRITRSIRDTYPYRSVARIVSTFRDGAKFAGSGIFVSADGVFTAAHIVYKKDHGGLATKVEITPGYDGGAAPFGTTGARRIEVMPEYITTKDPNYDFAAIITDDPSVGTRSGWLGFIVPPSINLGTVRIIGFPRGGAMTETSSRGTLSFRNKIAYTADTENGMSGAPIIIQLGPLDRDYRVIGVHNGAGNGQPINLGTRFFDAILRNVNRRVR